MSAYDMPERPLDPPEDRFDLAADDDADRFDNERNDFIVLLYFNPDVFSEAANDYLAENDNGDIYMLARIVCRAFRAEPGVESMTDDERREFCKLCERIADWAIDEGLDYAPDAARSADELRDAAMERAL